jgi:CDGSH-type Zn-finger protein
MKITIRPHGPIRLELEGERDSMTIVDHDGNAFGLAGRKAIQLCRCGHSQNKPFCDGSHNRVGFDSLVEARDLPPPKG